MKKRWWIIGAVAVAGAGLVGFLSNQPESVSAIRMKPEDVAATLTITGEVKADQTTSFSPPVTARIARLYADDGDLIRPGQLLATLDNGQIRAQLSQAQAIALQARESYIHTRQGTRAEQLEYWKERYQETLHKVQQGQHALLAAQARAKDATRNAKRFEDLHRQEMVSVQEYDSAQLQEDIARQEVERLRADLAGAWKQKEQVSAQLREAQNGPTRPEVGASLAAAQAAQANAQAIQAQLADYEIRSNISGIITERLKSSGDLAKPGEPVFKAVDPATLQIVCAVEENDLSKVHVGDTAYVVLDALPDRALEGTVKRVGSQVNPENGTVEARVILTRNAWATLSGIRLMPGMTADVNVITNHFKNTLILPATAVRNHNNQWFAYVFRNGQLQKQLIRAERISIENFKVTSGLKPGEWVAAFANEKLLTKKHVKPLLEPEPPKIPDGVRTP